MKKNVEPLKILVVDDDPTILFLFRKIFDPKQKSSLFSSHIELFDTNPLDGKRRPLVLSFELLTCRQGDEAVDVVKRSLQADTPISVAFLDIRLPPGPDGIWTAQQIRALDPHIEFVMVSAHSDVGPKEIAPRVLPTHKLLFIQKPFHPLEIYQMITALGAKWKMENEIRRAHENLENQVKDRTAELMQTNLVLNREITERKQIEGELRLREKDLENKTLELEETNTALGVLLKKLQEEKKTEAEKVAGNVKELIKPFLLRLKKSRLNRQQGMYLNMLESNLNRITSPFLLNLNSAYTGFTPKEIQVAQLIKDGKSSKEIAVLLNSTERAVEFHRSNLRNKLGLKNKKANLRTFLLSIS